MRLHLIVVGKRMPAWIREGFNEYNKRLPAELRLDLIEISPAVRGKSIPVKKAVKEEEKRIRAAVPNNSLMIAFDEKGKQMNSIQLSKKIESWFLQGRDVSLIIGGADGLNDDFKKSADEIWSLSAMTLPHSLVRVIIAEQIYRAWTILKNHPYHRE
ncbi:MAG: 23S rRNA (pseudouridine(1915)-N(3))-methyltransferase RlmH [Gammaproteobacteria bacterium]|nr:23S rRNA (pseudouridine(1915)-N(3))-methyltransferase RlmH [Gammaproteobacteria bacterium]